MTHPLCAAPLDLTGRQVLEVEHLFCAVIVTGAVLEPTAIDNWLLLKCLTIQWLHFRGFDEKFS